jgi:hypothetical protein
MDLGLISSLLFGLGWIVLGVLILRSGLGVATANAGSRQVPRSTGWIFIVIGVLLSTLLVLNRMP